MRSVLFALMAVGCTDYELNPQVEEVEPAGEQEEEEYFPQIEVTPEKVGGDVVCAFLTEDISIANVGEAPLTVTELTPSNTDWEISTTEELPWSLEPGESREATIEGLGAGSLLVISNDPDNPSVDVDLSAWLDEPPTVSLLSPSQGDILNIDGAALFEAQVSDDTDALDSLMVNWTSDIDGTLNSDPPNSSGLASFEWLASDHTSGTHAIDVAVVDSCGNISNTGINICQDEGYTEEELALDSWFFDGSASWDTTNNWLILTTPLTDQAGTAFQTSATVDASAVEIRFSFYQGDGTGADGIALTALDSDRMTSFVGGSGGSIGYGGLPGWSIEVDTYCNGHDPTCDDHLSLHFDGDAENPAVWASIPEMEDTGWHEMVVTINAPTVSISIDGVTYIDQDVDGYYSFPAYIGFTAATGSLTNNHLIDSLTVERSICEDK